MIKNDKVYLLIHWYEYGQNNEHDNVVYLGIYSSFENTLKAIDRYYTLEEFKKHPKECLFQEAWTIDKDECWREGFIDEPSDWDEKI